MLLSQLKTAETIKYYTRLTEIYLSAQHIIRNISNATEKFKEKDTYAAEPHLPCPARIHLLQTLFPREFACCESCVRFAAEENVRL